MNSPRADSCLRPLRGPSESLSRPSTRWARPATDERREIEEWLSTNDTSPTTGQELPHKIFCPNFTLRSQIKTFLENHRGINASV